MHAYTSTFSLETQNWYRCCTPIKWRFVYCPYRSEEFQHLRIDLSSLLTTQRHHHLRRLEEKQQKYQTTQRKKSKSKYNRAKKNTRKEKAYIFDQKQSRRRRKANVLAKTTQIILEIHTSVDATYIRKITKKPWKQQYTAPSTIANITQNMPCK